MKPGIQPVGSQFQGYYLDRAQLNLQSNTRPAKLETGDHWIVWLSAFESGGSWASERGRQTTIFIEFATMPPLNQPVDLTSAPLQVRYEYGGQKLMTISQQVTGTLTLSPGQDNSFVAQWDATFVNPILGSGTKVIQGQTLLKKHPHPDFSTP
jgi:hypothetical protein